MLESLFGPCPEEEMRQARALLQAAHERIDAMTPDRRAELDARGREYMRGYKDARNQNKAAIERAIAEEREECARILEADIYDDPAFSCSDCCGMTLTEMTKRIRARGNS